MLIRFSVSNFLSFKEKAELFMVASNERIHSHHIFRTASRSHPNILRSAVIYGANSAGKSNLFKAIKFARFLVVTSMSPETKIPVKRFKLDAECMHKPAQFEIEFRAKNTNYLYSFAVTPSEIPWERLYTTTNSGEVLLFSRTTSEKGRVEVEWGAFIEKLSDKDRLFLEFIVQGTRPNQLFLRETIERNMDRFRPISNWFRRTLQVIEPTTAYRDLELRLGADEEFREFLARVLKNAGTGISNIKTQEEGIDTITDLPEEMIRHMQEQIDDGSATVVRNSNGARHVITKRGDELRVVKLTTVHSGNTSVSEAIFEVHEESDGTQRLFDLVPMLYDLTVGSDTEKVYIIDEVGRSLHPHLTNMIVDMHLDASNAQKPCQLIVTTHETHLLDLEILRRDEIWFVEKKGDGSTDLYSLSDFQPRYDKDIRKDYLVGRYGGIPFIGNTQYLRLPNQKQRSDETVLLED